MGAVVKTLLKRSQHKRLLPHPVIDNRLKDEVLKLHALLELMVAEGAAREGLNISLGKRFRAGRA